VAAKNVGESSSTRYHSHMIPFGSWVTTLFWRA